MVPGGQLAAVAIAADAQGHARLLAEVREAVLAGGPAPRQPREVVSSSWQRCLRAGVNPAGQPPVMGLEPAAVREVRAEHPLAAVLPLLRATLMCVADEALHVMVVCDEGGNVLWMDGQSDVRRLAERICFVEGARWTEDSVGTNAIGTALAVDGPVQIYAAEHYSADQHSWTCAASPIHDPDTGRTLGVVDVSGPLQTIHPSTAALVDAAARLAEGHLRARAAARDERARQRGMAALAALGTAGALLSASGRVLAAHPPGVVGGRIGVPVGGGPCRLPDGRAGFAEPLDDGFLLRLSWERSPTVPAVRRPHSAPADPDLQLLGADRPRIRWGGRSAPLSLRHAELLAVLALHPRGSSADQLAEHLYGERGNPVTVRAELHRLRATLDGLIATRPYRFAVPVDADFRRVRRLVGEGRLASALAAYPGPLLPASDAPAVREERDELAQLVARVVAEQGDVPSLLRWVGREEGADDVAALRRLLALLPPGDPRRAAVAVHLDRLEASVRGARGS